MSSATSSGSAITYEQGWRFRSVHPRSKLGNALAYAAPEELEALLPANGIKTRRAAHQTIKSRVA